MIVRFLELEDDLFVNVKYVRGIHAYDDGTVAVYFDPAIGDLFTVDGEPYTADGYYAREIVTYARYGDSHEG